MTGFTLSRLEAVGPAAAMAVGGIGKIEAEIIPWPSTLLEAAKLLIDALSMEDRIAIADMGLEVVALN